MFYLSSITEVKEAVKKRRKESRRVQGILDGYIAETYGVEGWSDLLASHLACKGQDPDTSYGVLARQVPSMSAEDISGHLLAHQLGLSSLALAFHRDAFHSGSNDKLMRVKIPFVSWSKKRNLMVSPRVVVTNIVGNSLTDMNMVRLDKLQVGEQELPEYHRDMQQSVSQHFPKPYHYGDISKMWGEVLARAQEGGKQPRPVWKSGPDGKDVKWETGYTAEEARALVVRPSSKWYYFMYLSMFLDGRFVLLESFDNPDLPEARNLFETQMQAVYKATGYRPLIAKTYTLRTDMLYVNQHILDKPQEAAQELSSARHWTDDTVAMSRWFADQAIQFGRV